MWSQPHLEAADFAIVISSCFKRVPVTANKKSWRMPREIAQVVERALFQTEICHTSPIDSIDRKQDARGP